jgi:hypothetical protein
VGKVAYNGASTGGGGLPALYVVNDSTAAETRGISIQVAGGSDADLSHGTAAIYADVTSTGGTTKFLQGRAHSSHSTMIDLYTDYSTAGVKVMNVQTAGGAGIFSLDGADNMNVGGTLAKAAGSFKIDHPLDPENKYLYHSFVESPDMKNIYDGVVKLNARGEAWVELPEYFEALNQDFRYQLTAIGAPGPRLHVAREISGNLFKIAGGTQNMKVSWQVTGVRLDAYADAHRVKAEVEKTGAERGTYLHPELFKKKDGEAINAAAPAASQHIPRTGQ